MKINRIVFTVVALVTVVIASAALPYNTYDWSTASGSYSSGSGGGDTKHQIVGDPQDYYDKSFMGVFPVSIFKFDNAGNFTLSAFRAGGEGAQVLCWFGGRWSDNQVTNVVYDPITNTISFKLMTGPAVCAIFPGS